MNKEQILSMSRNENNDEGFNTAKNKGMEKGTIAFCIVLLFLILFNFFTGQDIHALNALLWAFMAAESYPKYQFTKEKVYLVITIAGSIASICGLINYVTSVLG